MVCSRLTTWVPRRIKQLLERISILIRQILSKLTLIEWCVVLDAEAWRDFKEARQLIVKQLDLSKLAEVRILIDPLAHFVSLAIYLEMHPVVESLFHDFDRSIIVQVCFITVVGANAGPFYADGVSQCLSGVDQSLVCKSSLARHFVLI